MNRTVDKVIHKENSNKVIVESGFNDELMSATEDIQQGGACQREKRMGGKEYPFKSGIYTP
jgi:hypothetical protein